MQFKINNFGIHIYLDNRKTVAFFIFYVKMHSPCIAVLGTRPHNGGNAGRSILQ